MVTERYEEMVLCAAVLADPKQYPSVKHVHRDWFNTADYRAVWVGACWLLDQEATLAPAELVRRVRLLLLEHGRTNAAAKITMLTTAFPECGPQARSAAAAMVLGAQEDALVAASARASEIASQIQNPIEARVMMLREHWLNTLDQIDGAIEGDLDPTLQELNSMLERTADQQYDWVIPGMLERQERFMLIAPEKAGKSVLSRQVALMLAVGQHPFAANQPVPVMQTLIVDLENPEAVLRRDFRRQVENLELWSNQNQHVWIMHRPAGLHLGDPRDEQALDQAMSFLRPDLLVISPIYKAYNGLDKSWEEQAFGVQKPLDRLRQKYRCAVWMEHHSPWGERGKAREIRPFGSSRWSRWLDYQAMLVPDDPRPPFHRMQWQSVQRDERKMAPVALRRGAEGAPSWVPEWEDEEGGFGLAMSVATEQ